MAVVGEVRRTGQRRAAVAKLKTRRAPFADGSGVARLTIFESDVEAVLALHPKDIGDGAVSRLEVEVAFKPGSKLNRRSDGTVEQHSRESDLRTFRQTRKIDAVIRRPPDFLIIEDSEPQRAGADDHIRPHGPGIVGEVSRSGRRAVRKSAERAADVASEEALIGVRRFPIREVDALRRRDVVGQIVRPGGIVVWDARDARADVVNQSGTRGRGNQRKHLLRCGAEARRGDHVAREGEPRKRVVYRNQRAARIAQLGKVAISKFRRGDGVARIEARPAKLIPIHRNVKECPVLPVIELGYAQWSANGEAVFVLLVDGSGGREKPARIENRVANEIEGVPMIEVGPLAHVIVLDALAPAILGGKYRCQNLEFVDRLVRGINIRLEPIGFEGSHRNAVEENFTVEIDTAIDAAGEAIALDAGNQKDKAVNLPASAAYRERKILDDFGFDGRCHFHHGAVDLRRRRAYFDRFSRIADRERNVDRSHSAEGQPDVLGYADLETGFLGGYLVYARCQRGDCIAPALAARGFRGSVRFRVQRRNLCILNESAGSVGDDAGYGSRISLGL